MIGGVFQLLTHRGIPRECLDQVAVNPHLRCAATSICICTWVRNGVSVVVPGSRSVLKRACTGCAGRNAMGSRHLRAWIDVLDTARLLGQERVIVHRPLIRPCEFVARPIKLDDPPSARRHWVHKAGVVAGHDDGRAAHAPLWRPGRHTAAKVKLTQLARHAVRAGL